MATPEAAHGPRARLARRIEAETGLQFAGARGRDLDSGLRRIALARGVGEAAAVDWLLAGPWDAARTDLCARHLTIGETYFFREPRGLELLCDQARRKLAAGAPLRVWSAGCCTGEEPYSMAMALRAALPRFDPAQVSILATDLNEASLAFARAAVYREWSFRRTPPAMRAAWSCCAIKRAANWQPARRCASGAPAAAPAKSRIRWRWRCAPRCRGLTPRGCRSWPPT
jgi:chemotaxis protein methyltransferase CheR